MDRTYTEKRTASEREVLEEHLDWLRDGVLAKVEGLTDEQASAAVVPSGVSIAGLVKHLALVEDAWFQHDLAGNPDPEPWAGIDWDATPDWEFDTAKEEPLADSVALYRTAIDRSRSVAAAYQLDEFGTDPRRQAFSLRWLYVHMIEETARHLGHLDILRELADGSTGV